MKKISVFLFSILLIISLTSCVPTEPAQDIWSTAEYTEDTTLGTGEKTIYVDVVAQKKEVKFTILTNKEYLANALLENHLVSGKTDQFGLYIKTVNGMLADYDINNSYWALNKNGEPMQTGASQEIIENGNHYEIIYTVQP